MIPKSRLDLASPLTGRCPHRCSGSYDKAGIDALKFLQAVVATGPAGIAGYGQGESNTAFLQGQAAMSLDSTSIAGLVNDPSKSKVVGNVSWALHPKGVRRASQSGGLGLAIPKNAKTRRPAFCCCHG